MKEFSGKIHKGADTWHYESLYNGDMFCHDSSRHFEPYNYDVPSWGHESYGTLRLAAVMLAIALTPDECMDTITEDDGYEDDNGDWISVGGDEVRVPMLGFTDVPTYSVGEWERQRAIVNKHYTAFANEVLANLPDEWSMSRQEILDWIKAREVNEPSNNSNG